MRPIDADALKEDLTRFYANEVTARDLIDEQPTIGGWISVKDRLPEEHDSLFAKNPHLSKYMWAKESDDVIVYVRFQDGSGRSTEGRLRDGKWHTKISPFLEPVITHWMSMPGEPKEE
jgi:hypothetical protein